MSWLPIVNDNAKVSGGDVAVGCTRAGRMRQQLFIIVRGETLAASPWLAVGTRVAALLGSGEHHGMLRLQPGNDWTVGKPASRPGAVAVSMLRIMPQLKLPASGMKAMPVEFDFSDQWLELTLPGWAVPVAGQPAAATSPLIAAPPVAAKPDGKPAWPSSAKVPDLALGAPNRKDRHA